MKKTVLRDYAKLIAKMGVNVQKGQEVVITAELDQPEFVQMVAEECYKLGASKVRVEWQYQPLVKTQYRYCSLKTLSTVEKWEREKLQHSVDVLPCRIFLDSDDPDGLKGINQTKMAKAARNRYPIIKPYRDQIDNKDQWCIAAVPGRAWAKKLFPELRVTQAVEKLWEAILSTSRVDGDPIRAWEEHNKDLHERCAYLNGLGIRSLHYTASNGTDLTVGMIPEGMFLGGDDANLKGIRFNPNIPSEECFTTPKKGEAEGIVYSSMPLSYQGQLIENFWLRFKDGKVVECAAEKNEALLKQMVSMDENAGYLGECALVPYDSPIRNSGLLFYNTLFDENAACHLALGMGFKDTIRDFGKYEQEDFEKLGVNDSMIHTDFMIGTADLNIDAETRDGKTVPIFRNGNWAF